MHGRYAQQFALHRAAAELFEAAIAKPRPLVAVEDVAIDIMMTQAYKSHYAVRLMAERAQTEDAAVLTRRLMELAAQAAYIATPADEAERQRRSGHYLANLWREAPAELKQHIPAEATARWQAISARYAATLPRRGWAPQFKQIFDAIGQSDTYEQDYRFLSSIAHGSTEDAILHYSMPTVMLRAHLHVPSLLNYSTRYYLALGLIWDDRFHLVDQDAYERDFVPLFDAEFQSASSEPPTG